jgi:hypothetical protein
MRPDTVRRPNLLLNLIFQKHFPVSEAATNNRTCRIETLIFSDKILVTCDTSSTFPRFCNQCLRICRLRKAVYIESEDESKIVSVLH